MFYALRDARRAGADAEAARLDAELRRLTAAAGALEEANAFGALLQHAGAVGLNATTSHDATKCGPPWAFAWHTATWPWLRAGGAAHVLAQKRG